MQRLFRRAAKVIAIADRNQTFKQKELGHLINAIVSEAAQPSTLTPGAHYYLSDGEVMCEETLAKEWQHFLVRRPCTRYDLKQAMLNRKH
ncbi:hypothetical protein ACPV3S_13000 [Photobacterium damselae]|uniref:hypothetical protein n=1 Tax=Photobacterium damselae TaxID=38293 RepID=UPI004067C11F